MNFRQTMSVEHLTDPSSTPKDSQPRQEATTVAPQENFGDFPEQPSGLGQAVALKRVQRERGNRFVQRLVSQTRESAPDRHLPPASSPGKPLDPVDRTFLEHGFAADFGDVRIHADPDAASAADSLNARAFTLGRDIYFGAGNYQTSTPEGRHLLAHELAHTVQQAATPQRSPAHSDNDALLIGPEQDCLEDEADRAADTVMAGHGDAPPALTAAPLLLQRQPAPTPTPASTPTPTSAAPIAPSDPPLTATVASSAALKAADDVLQTAEVTLSDEDKKSVLGHFSSGFTLTPHQSFALGIGANSVSSVRVNGFRIVDATPISPSIESFIFRVGKGRAILVSSAEGPSILLDAGGPNASAFAGLSAVVGAGLSSAPDRVLISHTDSDHLNNLGRVLAMPGMNRTVVEIGLQQFQNIAGQADWARANIQFQPAQSMLLIDVQQASGVHVQRRVIGNMEITELRLVSAARTLGTPGQALDRYKRAKNASSPVTIVQDIETGKTTLYSADGTGRAISEMVDIVGEEPMREMLGGGGANLAMAEAPHHGGREDAGPDARGRIRALRLQFEASDGTLRFFTQTSQSFSGSASASIRYLDQVGIDTERVFGQPDGTLGRSVVRARGAVMEDITIDNGAVRQVLEIARANETEIMSGYAQLHQMNSLRSRIQLLHEAVSAVGVRQEVAKSLQQLLTELDSARGPVQQSIENYWQALEIATAGGPGIRASADTAAVNTAAGAIQAAVERNPTTPFSDSIGAHEGAVSLEMLLLQNTLQMYQALNENRPEDLETLKSEQTKLLASSAGLLGAKEVREHVRAAWKATSAVWTEQVFQRISRRMGSAAKAQRERETDFHGVLSDNLRAQLRTMRIAESAGGGSTMPLRTRVGAGFMLFVELFRIGLEFAEDIKQSNDADEVAAANRAIRGRNMVQWWLSRGVAPEVALVDSDGKQVAADLSQKRIYEVLNPDQKVRGEIPEFDRVVVVDVPVSDRQRAVAQLTLEAVNLDDWYRLVEDERYSRSEKGWTPFIKQEERWLTLLFNTQEGGYQGTFDQKVNDELEALYINLRKNTDTAMAAFAAANPELDVATIQDSGWIRTLRYAWVWERHGGASRIDFGHTKPRVFDMGPADQWGPEGKHTIRAADVPTYERLRQYLWPVDEVLGMSATYGGYGDSYLTHTLRFKGNSDGLAYADPGDLSVLIGPLVEKTFRESQSDAPGKH